jgi:hypothetical protein
MISFSRCRAQGQCTNWLEHFKRRTALWKPARVGLVLVVALEVDDLDFAMPRSWTMR